MRYEKEKRDCLAQTSSKILFENPSSEVKIFVDKPMEFYYYFIGGEE
jgi:hypothetical protein